MIDSNVKHIKIAQKESLLFKELSQLFLQITLDDSRLNTLSINRVKLSPDKSACSVLFFHEEGIDKFNELKPLLILYKPSLRKAIAHRINARKVPELFFKFDKLFSKQQRIEELLEKIKEEEEL